MHIVHIDLAKGFREGEAQTLLLMKYLRKQGIHQTLVCRKKSELGAHTEAAGILTQSIPGPLSGHWKSLGGDIVHVHDNRSIYWAWFEYFFSKTPYVVTRRTANPISRGYLTHRAFRNAAGLVATSEESALTLSASLYRPVEVIPSASYTEEDLGFPWEGATEKMYPDTQIQQLGQSYLKLYDVILQNPTGFAVQTITDAPVIDPASIDPLTIALHTDSRFPPH